jgi:hypothetical protein
LLFILIGFFVQSGDDFIFVHPEEGCLSSAEDTDTLYLRTNISPVYIAFDSDTGLHLWASVYNENAALLGYFELQENEIIELTGSGKFMITLFTETGSGVWRCFYSPYRKELSARSEKKNEEQY